MKLFDLCERGNHFYNTKEYDRALYYYDMAIQKGYDGLQIIQRAQRLKGMGVVAKPPIHVGKAMHLIRVKQEVWRQIVFVKGNYPEKLLISLEAYKGCVIDKGSYTVDEDDRRVRFMKAGKPVMEFKKVDGKNNKVTCQVFTEMEKYYKTKVIDGKKIKIPAKRKKYHFFIVYDSFTDLLVQLTRLRLFEQTYYEEHREALEKMIDDEYGSSDRLEIANIATSFIFWLESFSVLHHLFKNHTNQLEIDVLKEVIHDELNHYITLIESEPIFKIDYFFFILVFLQKLYERFPAENRDKYDYLYDTPAYLVCKKFRDTFKEFLDDISQSLITEPVLHEFTKFIGQFRKNLFA
ncbi:MAG: hypothetical protein ACTSUE_15360 [Promethearchaeota archaeon]